MSEKYTFFFRTASPFSQFHPCEFVVDGLKYSCAEQYMMHQKAVLFKDYEHAEQIMKANQPKEMKRLGREVQNYDDKIWNATCEEVVRRGNIAKFTQNSHLRKALLATTGTVLVEASPFDRKWGIGLGEKNPKALNKATWRGKNLLGYILTEVRDKYLDEREEESSSESVEEEAVTTKPNKSSEEGASTSQKGKLHSKHPKNKNGVTRQQDISSFFKKE